MRRKILLEVLNSKPTQTDVGAYADWVKEKLREVLGIAHPPKGMDPEVFDYSNAMGLQVGDRIRYIARNGEAVAMGRGTVVRLWFGLEEAIDVLPEGTPAVPIGADRPPTITLYPGFPSTIIQVLPEGARE